VGTSIDYSTVSHETIYQHITQGPGSGSLVDASQESQGIATELQAVQGLLAQAVRGIGAAQQGAAADAATHATTGLFPWIADAGTAAKALAARISEQAASFTYTRDSMPPPRVVPEVSFSQDPATWTADHAIEWLPGIQTSHEADAVAAQQDQERARELMIGYQGNSNDNLGVRDHFAPAPTVVADVADPTTCGVGVGGGWGGQHPHSSLTHPSPVQAHPPSTHAAPLVGGHGVPAHAAPAAAAAQLAPGAAATTPQLAGGYPSTGDVPMVGTGAGQPVTAAPFGPSPVLAAPGTGDRVRGGSRHSGGGGAYRASSFGPRPTAFSTGDSHLSEPRLSGSSMQSAEQASAGRVARGAGGAGAPLASVVLSSVVHLLHPHLEVAGCRR
jgi:hypothetical protein